MGFNCFDHQQTASNRCLSWDGLRLECLQPSRDFLDVVVGCTIAQDVSPESCTPPFPVSNLHLTLRLDWLDASIAQQVRSVSLPFHYHCTIIDPAILHLVQLLQAEMQTQQPMSQIVVSSIATILTTHLLQHWQTEQCQN